MTDPVVDVEAMAAFSKVLRGWLLLAATVEGAAVMAVEVLGARMLSVSFGGSLSVWAGMISVTLLSLTAGYFIGGWLADRRPRPIILGLTTLVAALLIAACPYTRFVLEFFSGRMGLESGALAGSAVIFFLPLGLMGMIGPFVIRLLSQGRRGIGTTAGAVYAISTLGSVAGTLLTGLWLIPRFGTTWSFQATAITLAVTGALGLVLCLPGRGAVSLLLPIGLFFLPEPGLAVGVTYKAPDGDPVRVLAVEDSAYGRLAVLEKGSYRLLVANGIVQTGVPRNIAQIPKAEALAGKYFQELLPYTVDDPIGRQVLIIGLAGGMTASLLRQYDMDVDAVDLDPAVIALARKYFWFEGPAVAADGRRYLDTCPKKYDFCVIDTYSGDVFPFHLSSVEAFRAARAVLKQGGILAINFIGTPRGEAFTCMARTLQEVFAHVQAIRGEEGDDVQTITFFASDQPIEFNHGWTRYLSGFRGVDPVSDAIRRMTIPLVPGTGLVLSDDHNPIDFLRAEEALRWRQRMARFIGSEAAGF